MKKVFSVDKWLKSQNLGCDDEKQIMQHMPWVTKCIGKTEQQILNMNFGCADEWLVDVEDEVTPTPTTELQVVKLLRDTLEEYNRLLESFHQQGVSYSNRIWYSLELEQAIDIALQNGCTMTKDSLLEQAREELYNEED